MKFRSIGMTSMKALLKRCEAFHSSISFRSEIGIRLILDAFVEYTNEEFHKNNPRLHSAVQEIDSIRCLLVTEAANSLSATASPQSSTQYDTQYDIYF